MKILHLNSNYFYTHLHKELINSIESLDTTISNDVFSPLVKNAQNIKVQDSQVIAPICFNNFDRFLFTFKQKKIMKALKNEISQFNYDVIHAHTLFTDGNIAYELYKEFDIPYVITVRNTDINSFFKKRINLRKKGIEILRNANKVIFLSKSYKNELLDNYINNSEDISKIALKSFVIPNGINDFWLLNKNNPRELSSNDIKILYVGRIEKNKNLTTTIEALKQLIKRGYNIEYSIVGKIHDQMIFNEVTENSFVKYYEPLPKELLIHVFYDNDIFVMPSIYESFGLVYAEALSQGLPIIYSKGQGFDQQFEDGFIGYGVEKLNPNDIANKIELIVQNYNTLSEHAIKNADVFSWKNNSEKHIEVYNDIVKEDLI